MRYLVLGILMTAGLVALVIDAAADDSYYGDGTSRWEHAGRLGSQSLVVGTGIIAALVTIWVFTRARPRSTPPPASALFFAVLLYSVSWFMAWISMGIGH